MAYKQSYLKNATCSFHFHQYSHSEKKVFLKQNPSVFAVTRNTDTTAGFVVLWEFHKALQNICKIFFCSLCTSSFIYVYVLEIKVTNCTFPYYWGGTIKGTSFVPVVCIIHLEI